MEFLVVLLIIEVPLRWRTSIQSNYNQSSQGSIIFIIIVILYYYKIDIDIDKYMYVCMYVYIYILRFFCTYQQCLNHVTLAAQTTCTIRAFGLFMAQENKVQAAGLNRSE